MRKEGGRRRSRVNEKRKALREGVIRDKEAGRDRKESYLEEKMQKGWARRAKELGAGKEKLTSSTKFLLDYYSCEGDETEKDIRDRRGCRTLGLGEHRI